MSKRVVNGKHSDEDSSSDDTSSTSTLSEESESTASASASDDDGVLYEKQSFVTCRGATDTFYLCQILKNVYENTKKIPIRWCSVIGEDGDDTKISIKTQFKLSYTDTLDPAAILLDVSSITEHAGGVFSLKKQDIVDSNRLLQKSIRGESLSSDDMMDLSTEHPPKAKKVTKHIRFNSEEDESDSSSSETSKTEVPASKKRKLGSTNKKSRKQPPKKRTRKTEDESDDAPSKFTFCPNLQSKQIDSQ